MERYCLSNGIVVLVDEKKEDLSTSCVFQFLTGSINENGSEGVAHFLEHILFSGTTSRTKLDIKNEFQDLGCYYNASTSLFKTKFYIKTINEYFVSAFMLLADIISNPVFDNNMIDIERKVIKDEILKNNENIVNFEVEKFRKALLSKNQFGRLVLGTVEDIDKIDRTELQSYYQNNFTSKNLVIAFSGNIGMEEAIKLVEDNVELKKDKPRHLSMKNTVITKTIKVVNSPSQQVTVCIFMQGLGSKQSNYEAYQMLIAILGGNTNSRLFRKLRDELGLVYHIQSFTENYIEFGLWGISFSCNISCVHEAIKSVIKIIKEIKGTNPITDYEIEQAKKEYKVSLITGLETTSSRANFMATQYWNGHDIHSLFEPIFKMEQVSRKDVGQIIEKVLQIENISLLVVGGNFSKDDFMYVNE